MERGSSSVGPGVRRDDDKKMMAKERRQNDGKSIAPKGRSYRKPRLLRA
jgi:hypothetical protein